MGKDEDNEDKKEGNVKDRYKVTLPNGEIRCYGKAGFLYPVTKPDGTVEQRFCYGRDGD